MNKNISSSLSILTVSNKYLIGHRTMMMISFGSSRSSSSISSNFLTVHVSTADVGNASVLMLFSCGLSTFFIFTGTSLICAVMLFCSFFDVFSCLSIVC